MWSELAQVEALQDVQHLRACCTLLLAGRATSRMQDSALQQLHHHQSRKSAKQCITEVRVSGEQLARLLAILRANGLELPVACIAIETIIDSPWQ